MPSQLAQVIACGTLRASNWCHHINVAMTRWGIDTPARIAHFLAQVPSKAAGYLAWKKV